MAGRPSQDEKALARTLAAEKKETAAQEREVMRSGGYATNLSHEDCGICGKRPAQTGGRPCVRCSAEFFGGDWCGSARSVPQSSRSGSRREAAAAAPQPAATPVPTPVQAAVAAPVLAPLAAETGTRPARKRKRSALDGEPTLFTVRK